MKFSLAQVAAALGLSWSGRETVTGWSIDSRTLQRGDLFFALPGANRNGGEFVDAALSNGAVAAVASEAGERVLCVPDVLAALQKLAHWAVGQWGGDIVAVTGSAGKTSTKDLIAEMLSMGLPTGKTEGNLNNHIGIPLSVLRLDSGAQAAVLEYGMNHAGEIRELCAIARPRIAVVTNVGAAHIENFDSIEGIAAAKRELVEALPEGGIAVLNADDPRVAAFAGAHSGRSILYGLDAAAEVRAEDVEIKPDGFRFRVGTVTFETALSGLHSVRNILAGIAVASLYGIPAERLTGVVRRLQPGKMRGERLEYRGIHIINDCYNSNPDAAKAMLDVLAATPAQRKVAVLGEMLELVDLARVIVLDHVMKTDGKRCNLYADFDVPDLRLRDAWEKMNKYGMALGTDNDGAPIVENSYFGFGTMRGGKKRISELLKATVPAAEEGYNGFSAFSGCASGWAEKFGLKDSKSRAVPAVTYPMGYAIPHNPKYDGINTPG